MSNQNSSRSCGPGSAALGVIVAMALLVSPAASLSGSATGLGRLVGALSVGTDPAGAGLYVDGKFVGQTPIRVDQLVVGDHRVRVVKDGYLENSRVVAVAEHDSTLQIKLTRSTSVESPAAVAAAPGGGSKKKWLLLGAAAGGATAAAVALTGGNHPPEAGTVSTSPSGTGIAGFTTYAFTAQGARDADNNSLTITWDFGDGGAATGATPTHQYASAGTFPVSYTVSDGKKTVTAPTATVTVGGKMSGVFTGGVEPGFNDPFSINLTQNSSTLGGSTSFASGSTVSGLTGSFTGTAYPVTVTYTQAYTLTCATIVGTATDVFSGSTDSTGNTITGSMTVTLPSGCVFVGTGSRTATGSITLKR